MARSGRGLSRVELARRAGIALSTVYLIEGGVARDIRLSTLHKLARALRVSPLTLLRRCA